MEELSVHDNHITGYEVDGKNRRIVLHTEFVTPDREEFTDVVFEGVFGYRFELDNFTNIVFGVEESTIEKLVRSEKPSFEYGVNYRWPGEWNKGPEEAIEYLTANGAKAYYLASSLGMVGWVAAKSCCLIAVKATGGPV